MPLDGDFYRAVAPLARRGMGTENIGPLLYWLVCMTRPRNVLEVGLGYTTPFIAQGLHDSVAEFAADKRLMESGTDPERVSVLASQHLATVYAPRLHAIDDYSIIGSSARQVQAILRDMGLSDFVQLHEGDFRGRSRAMPAASLPLDMVWYDCGGFPEYVDFIREYWQLINPDHGLLILHFTYWPFVLAGNGVLQPKMDRRPIAADVKMVSNPILNEFKKQQSAAGHDAHFEVLSLLESHKEVQGSVSLIRKLAPTSRCRQADFRDEAMAIFGAKPESLGKL